MSHSHSHEDVHVQVGARAKAVLIGFLAVLAMLTAAGLIWLWPSAAEVKAGIHHVSAAEGVTESSGRITKIADHCEGQFDSSSGPVACVTYDVTVLEGPDKGSTQSVEVTGPQSQAGLRSGDVVQVSRIDNNGDVFYAFRGVDRTPVFIALAVMFVVAVIAVARWKGFFALLGLVVAGGVLVRFIIPGILLGKPGVLAAIVGSTAIMFVVVYVAHGISIRTSTALAGTMLGLVVTAGLGYASVYLAKLTGFAEETEWDLQNLAPGLDFRQLLIAGLIIGGLGVLNDTTITQAAAVFELRAAAPAMSRREIFASGMRIGRDHIASTIYTIVFAYAGGALVVIMLVYFTSESLLLTINQEMFASEIIRTLGSSIGLILSVPITTGIAALAVGPAQGPAREIVPD